MSDSILAFDAAINAIDAANAQDPSREVWQGQEQPAALLYGWRMSECLSRYASSASEALRLAARAQHIERWRIPRNSYPLDRPGYHRWRRELAQFHAERAGAILREAGYGAELIERVQRLLRKENRVTDAECQTLEDVICLVFLEYYLEDFAARQAPEKLPGILQKTWAKMSPRGHDAALALPLLPVVRAQVAAALGA